MKSDEVYHFGPELYNDIKNPVQQSVSAVELKERYGHISEMSGNSISAFFGKINIGHINKLKKNGFKPWDIDKVYRYKISMKHNASAIEEIRFYSTPEETAFADDNWSKFTSHCKTKLCYDKARTAYVMALHEAMKDCKCARVPMGIFEFSINYRLEEYRKISKYIDINIECGNRNQYASCIPHMQTTTTAPLEYNLVDFINIKDGYTLEHIDDSYEDIDELNKLYNKAFDVKYKRNDIIKILNKGHVILARNIKNEIIGLLKYVFEDNIIWLSDLISIKKGFGTILVNYFLDITDIKYNSEIRLTAFRLDLIPYYERFGFKRIPAKGKTILMVHDK